MASKLLWSFLVWVTTCRIATEHLWWRDLLKRPTRTLICKGENNEPFYFQLNTSYDKTHFLTGYVSPMYP